MAIPSCSEWSLPCNHCINRPSFNWTSKSTATATTIPFLTSKSRLQIANSSSCPPPILENDPPPVPVIELGLNFEPEDFNGFVRTLFKDPRTEELACEYYDQAKERPQFRPQKSTLKRLARYFIRTKNWNSIMSLSEDFQRFHVFPDSCTYCRLIRSCISARKFRLVNKLLDVLKGGKEEISLLAFDTAMRGYNKLHMYSSAIVVYERMKSFGIVLDPGCYCRIMEAYHKMGNHNHHKVNALFLEFQTRTLGIANTPFHTQVYRVICESLGKSGRPFEALEIFRGMKHKSIPADPSFYSSLISSFASIREVKMAEELVKEAHTKKMLRDPAVFLKLVLMYVEEGLMERTIDVVVESMKLANIRVSDCIFCAIVNGFSKKRGLVEAAKVYKELIAQGCEPGQVTYASILNVYCRLGLYSEAESLFSEMGGKGFDKCVVAYSSIVAMYGKTGRLRDAMRLVAKMKERGCEPNVWIYNTLLDMHGKVLNLRQVEKIWKEMKRRKVVPDKVSYTSIISAYSKAREFDMCMRYYYEYRLNGGGIDRAMAGIMVGVFSKLSRIDELVKLLQDLKMEGTRLDVRLYRSSLNALRDAGLQDQAKWLQQNFNAT